LERAPILRLPAQRAEAHRAGREALDDLGRGLDLLDRDRLARRSQLHQPAEQTLAHRLLVDQARVLRVGLAGVSVVPAGRVLKLGNRVRVPHVQLAVAAPLEYATNGQQLARGPRVGAEVTLHRLF